MQAGTPAWRPEMRWLFCPRSAGDNTTQWPPKTFFRLVHARIDAHQIAESLKAPGDGALVVFDGFVRNSFKGQPTEYLVYEAYEPMAYAKMREIGAQMREKFPIHRLAIVHRLGRLEIGETSVLIAVSSPHRAAAFDACRYGIDTLKRIVPIWKKEHFVGGAVWAEGETPHQEAISRSDESIPR